MFLDSVIKGAPVTVDVAGVSVPIKSGFRTSLIYMTMDTENSAVANARTLNLFYAKKGVLPDQVSKYPVEALQAASEWVAGAFDTITYGEQYRRIQYYRKKNFDWHYDAGIVTADFMRVYSIDLTSKSTQLHWYTFINLYLALLATPDTLTGQAVAARSPLEGDTTKEEERAHARRAQAWALPPTEDELREMALRNF